MDNGKVPVTDRSPGNPRTVWQLLTRMQSPQIAAVPEHATILVLNFIGVKRRLASCAFPPSASRQSPALLHRERPWSLNRGGYRFRGGALACSGWGVEHILLATRVRARPRSSTAALPPADGHPARPGFALAEVVMKGLCVFCGSSPGNGTAYVAAARTVGRLLAARRIALVYGGGRVGLMGAVADAALSAGGRVVGVIPRALMEREVGHGGLSELHVVETMHQRKAMMAELADGFLALPGGIGTMEEFFEVWTWSQLGIHRKPIGVLDVDGFFDPLVAFFDQLVREGFLRAEHRSTVLLDTSPELLLERLRTFEAPAVEKWIDLEQS